MKFKFIKNRWVLTINVILLILIVGGFIGFLKTKAMFFGYACVAGIFILPVYLVIYILYKKNMLKDFGISILISTIIMVFLGIVSSMAMFMAKSTGNKIDSNAWLSFFGALIGASITVLGSYLLTQLQLENSINKERKIQEDKKRSVQKMILVLLKNELQCNKQILNINIMKNYTQKNDLKIYRNFTTEKWLLVRKDLMNFINIKAFEKLFYKLNNLYSSLNKYNGWTRRSYSFKLSNKELKIYFNKLNIQFKDLKKDLNELIKYIE